MERSPKRARRDAAPPSLVDICDSRQELAILREEKARHLKKAAPYRAALGHEVWRRVAQLRDTHEQLDLALTAELGAIRSKTSAELRETAGRHRGGPSWESAPSRELEYRSQTA